MQNAELRDMEDYRDYRCPRECSGRSATCHGECERHKKYRKLNEERKKAVWQDQLDDEKGYMKKRRR